MVTDSPASPSTRIASSAAAPPPAGTSNAVNDQSMPVAANAALWMAGEREWRAGSPITAATRETERSPVTTARTSRQPAHQQYPSSRQMETCSSCSSSVRWKWWAPRTPPSSVRT